MPQNRPIVLRCAAVVVAALLSASAQAGPIWQRQLEVFDEYPADQGPWRSDARLKEYFHADYPNDLQVMFATGGAPELMWVTVLDYDKETGTYLGKLLNQPNLIDGLRIQDNVVFEPAEDSGLPVAVNNDGSFSAAGIPKYARQGTANDLYEAVRAYRLGNFGHNPPEITRCLALFESVARKTQELSQEDAYLASFVRGRCAAEAYETMLAIDSFRAALAIRPADFNTNMSLLAELSVAALNPDIQPKAQWETAYLQQW